MWVPFSRDENAGLRQRFPVYRLFLLRGNFNSRRWNPHWLLELRGRGELSAIDDGPHRSVEVVFHARICRREHDQRNRIATLTKPWLLPNKHLRGDESSSPRSQSRSHLRVGPRQFIMAREIRFVSILR